MTLLALPPEVPARAAPSCCDARVVANWHLTDRYWQLRLVAPTVAETVMPGQFVMLTPSRSPGDSLVLPRPMAVFDIDERTGTIGIVYGVVGMGTQRLATFTPGEVITTVGPLGRPFDVVGNVRRLLMLGRGIGICSLTRLVHTQAARDIEVTVVLSGRHADGLIGGQLCRSSGARVLEVSDDAGSSAPGTLHDQLVELMDHAPPDLVVVCGSQRLASLAGVLGRRWLAPVQISIEAHMACGLGYCHSCAVLEPIVATDTTEGAERPLVCTTGPVFQLI